MARAIFAPAAAADLVAIYEYVAADNPPAAAALIDRFEQQSQKLAEQPGIDFDPLRARTVEDHVSTGRPAQALAMEPVASTTWIEAFRRGLRPAPPPTKKGAPKGALIGSIKVGLGYRPTTQHPPVP